MKLPRRPPLWVLFLAPLVASAAVRGFWAPDEPRYAEVAREAWSGGGLLVMHLCGSVYPDKPPLLFWLAGLLGRLGDWSELWMRVPSLLATAGTTLLVVRLARRWWGELEAFWAPLLFLTFAMVTEIGGRLQIDPLLTFLIVAGIVALPTPETPTPRARGRVLVAGLCTGLALLAKGPVALVVVLLVVLAWGRFAGWGGSLRARDWVLALILALLPAAIWAGAATVQVPELGRELFFGQHAGRVVAEEAPHERPFYKHAVGLVLLLLPWTPLVVAGIVRGLARLRDRGDEGLARAFLWFVVLFVFFSLIPPKRDLYLLPAYPALALLAGRELALAIRSARIPRAVGPSIVLLLGLLTVALVVFGTFHERLVPRAGSFVPGLEGRLLILAVPAAAATFLAASGLRRSSPARWAASVAGGTAVLWLGVMLLVFAPLDRVKSTESLALELQAREERPATIPCIGVRPEGFRFYAGLPTVNGQLAEALEDEGEFLALIDERKWDVLEPEHRSRLRILDRRLVGSHLVLICGRAREDRTS